MKRWYVLQVYAGYEEGVKTDLARRLQDKGLADAVGQVLIPSARLKSLFDTGEAKSEQLFPGYVLIEMEMVPGIVPAIVASPRVIKFLGGSDPVPLSKKEVDRILSQMRGEVVVASADKSDFAEGAEVEIQEGPFAGWVGIIEKVDTENERLIVMVSIFGRMTPFELGFNQVKH